MHALKTDLFSYVQTLMSVQETMTAVRSVSTLLDRTTVTVRVASFWSMTLSVKVILMYYILLTLMKMYMYRCE